MTVTDIAGHFGPYGGRFVPEALTAALDQLDAAAGRHRGMRICLFHYPPIPPGRTQSRFSPLIEAAGATFCIYGHLHGQELGPAKVEGTWGGVTYRCASCDQVDFSPTLVCRV